MEHCSCSGTWAASLNRNEIENKLRVLESVAKFHKLQLLETIVVDVLARF
jgi:DNA polymerase epsilon subunit 1